MIEKPVTRVLDSLQLGKADWIYDHRLDKHLPRCARWMTPLEGGRVKCGYLLSGVQVEYGSCGAH